MENSEILKKTKKLIKKAGEAVLFYYDKEIKVDYKAPDSPLTLADIKSNEILLQGLKEFGYGILSEEGVDDKSRLNKGKAWIIDPLDGTSDFIDKTGEFTIIIGLVENGRPIFGLAYKPVGDVFYYAMQGQGAFKKIGNTEEKITVSKKNNLNNSIILSSRFHRSQAEIDLAEKYSLDIQTCGSAALKACLIAEGKGDFNFNPSDKTWEWDICGVDLILQEAGGKITDSQGEEILYNKENPRNKKGYLASNGHLHQQIIQEIENIQKNERL